MRERRSAPRRAARVVIEELLSVGLGDEVSYVVILREGVPERIVVKPAGADTVKKFMFNRGFSVFKKPRQ